MEYPSLLNRGSIVSCTTCFNQTIEGGVMAYDSTTKMLILKCEAESGQSKLNDVYVVNLELCSDLKIKQEVNTIPNAPPLLNIQRISTRKRNAVDEKKRLVDALNAGVTPEGQLLFMAIAKTIGQQVTWTGPEIMVFGDTYISPPYRSENVRGYNDRRVVYVKKLVDSHRKDVSPAGGSVSTTSTSSGAANTNNNSPLSTPTATGTGTVVTNSTGPPGAIASAAPGAAASNNNNPPNSNNNGTTNNNGATSINSTPSSQAAASATVAAAAHPQQSNNNNNNQATATSGASAN